MGTVDRLTVPAILSLYGPLNITTGAEMRVNWRTVTATIAVIFAVKYAGRKMIPAIKPFSENI